MIDFIETKDGGIKATSGRNVFIALTYDEEISSSLKYNSFTETPELIRSIEIGGVSLNAGELTGDFESILRVYLEQELNVTFSKQAVIDGMATYLKMNTYNPVETYMLNCAKKWDLKPRLDHLFVEYLGCENSNMTYEITRAWFYGAVLKVFHPSSKFDYVLDLVGSQGSGKTTLLKKLGGKWYTDNITDFSNKDNFEIMLKNLIINDDEMVASKKMSFDELKAFITKTDLRFRLPYGVRSEGYFKKFVIARTTNEITYLKDKTGERRFLPLLANKEKQKKHSVTDLTQDYIDQIWGEAVRLYQSEYTLEKINNMQSELENYRQDFMYIDEVEEMIDLYLDIDIPRDFKNFDRLSRHNYIQDMINFGKSSYGNPQVNRAVVFPRDIAYEVFNREITTDRKLANKIKYIMENKSDWKFVKRREGRAYKKVTQK